MILHPRRRWAAPGSRLALALAVASAGCATAPDRPMRPLTAQEAEAARLDPEARAVLVGLPDADAPGSTTAQRAERARARWEALAPYAAEPVAAAVRQIRAPGPGGEIALRAYRAPPDRGGALPAILFLHGGGYVGGTLDLYDSTCRALAQRAGALVIAVDYRLAPGAPFPAAAADVDAATRFVLDRAAELGADPSRLALAGDGAGAALAVAEAVELSRRGRAPRALALAYPLADARLSSPSWIPRPGRDLLISREDAQAALAVYLHGASAADPRASPVLFDLAALRGLPPTLLLSAQLDPARDDGEALAARLREAGVEVELRREPGLVHGFLLMAGAVEAARGSLERMGAFLGARLAGGR